MIRSFRDEDTETLFRLGRVRRFANIERPALRKLIQLDMAQRLDDSAHRRPTGWRSSPEIVPGNGACASMTNSASASAGQRAALKMLKSLITIE